MDIALSLAFSAPWTGHGHHVPIDLGPEVVSVNVPGEYYVDDGTQAIIKSIELVVRSI
jgi:hypothetical protein